MKLYRDASSGLAGYQQIHSESMYEHDYEQSILNIASEVFSGWKTVPFKTLIPSETRNASKADLALVEENFRDWWVVEVELEQHPFERHILPQVQNFRSGNYGVKHAEALAKSLDVDVAQVQNMIDSTFPKILVIIPSMKEEEVIELDKAGVKVCFIKVFESKQGGSRMYSVDGYVPERIDLGESAVVEAYPYLKKFLWIRSAAWVDFPHDDEEILIETDGQMATYKKRTYDGDHVLVPVSKGFELGEQERCQLYKLMDNRFQMLRGQNENRG